VENVPLAEGRIVVLVPRGHVLAAKEAVSVHDLIGESIIGVDPSDPYGAILAAPFRAAGYEPPYSIRGRFAQTVVSLVRHGLGVALIDEFSVAEVYMPGLVKRPLVESMSITAYVVTKRNRQLSSFSEFAIDRFRRELIAATSANLFDTPDK
jgi:DNA-binding transcriptional LysR family regulator